MYIYIYIYVYTYVYVVDVDVEALFGHSDNYQFHITLLVSYY